MRTKILLIALIGMSFGMKAQITELPNGNVGIGTTNPATLLNVNVGNGGSNGTAGLRIGGLENYASLELGIDGNYDGMIRSYGNNLKYYAGHWKIKGNTATENHSHNWYTSKAGSSNWSTVKMTLNHDGNLGIGTTNPATLLNVNVGNGGSNGTAGLRIGGLENYASLELGIDGNYDGMIRSYGNNLKYYAGHWKIKGNTATENHSHNWYTSKAGSSNWSTVKMTLNHDGNLGIGTIITGNHKLAVEGSIGAREIKVEANGWSDFVFYDDYKLPTLKEVENHIKEKGHLKDIPSAKEVEKNGFFLGAMDAKLLQKIEELTLYTIDQQKEIEELKKQNSKIDKQQKEIEELKSLVQKLLKDKN